MYWKVRFANLLNKSNCRFNVLRRTSGSLQSHRLSPLLDSASWGNNRAPSNQQQRRQWSDSGATAVQFRIVCSLSGPDMKFTFFLFSIRILDNFRFSPNFEMGWFPIRNLDNFRFSPNFEMGWFRQQSYFGQLEIQSEFRNGLIPNSDFGQL